MNIQELITQCKRKNQQAEKELFFRYAGKVLTLCRRYIKDEHEAKDYTQECFVRVFQKLEKYDAQKGAFEGWLYRVCTNCILQLMRKSKTDIPTIYPEQLPENENVEELVEMLSREQIIESIRELPVGYRKVFNLFFFEGWSHKEIATELEIKEKTSQSQLTRAKRMLRKILQKKINRTYERSSA
ncbi:MAG: RNA polymerase sigma factor [Bacteroidota bacterium]